MLMVRLMPEQWASQLCCAICDDVCLVDLLCPAIRFGCFTRYMLRPWRVGYCRKLGDVGTINDILMVLGRK
jgi:hypothetical protein